MALIYLIGYRATGKTTIGAMLASRLSCPFYDLDACLCQRTGKSVAEIVAQRGWEEFRNLEAENLRAVTAEAGINAVLATGGGIVVTPENIPFMRGHGLVFWLHAPEHILVGRLRASPIPGQRPSLTGGGLLEEIAAVLGERIPLYESCAHHKISSEQPKEAACAEILAKLDTTDGHI